MPVKNQKDNYQERAARRLNEDYKGKIPALRDSEPPEIGNVANLKGVKVLSDKMLDLNEDRAWWYLNLKPTDKERPVNERRVQALVDQMRLGRFNWDNVIMATAQLHGVTHKLNGQHTSWAVAHMQDHEPNYSGRIREIQYRVQTKQELIALYQTYDVYTSTRSMGHLVAMDVGDIPQLANVGNTLVRKVASATLFWQIESRHARKDYSPSQRRQVVEKHIDPVEKMVKFFRTHCKDRKDMRRTPVIAAMLATFDKVCTIAPEFWEPVATGLKLSNKTDPRYQLNQWLSSVTLNQTRGSDRKPTDDETMYRICLNCWNKWRDGQKMLTAPRATESRVSPK